MTLAALFLFGAFSITLSPFLGQTTPQQPASASSTRPSETQVQEASSGANSTNSQASSQSSTTQTPSSSKSASSKTRTRKKKPASQDCGASPAPSGTQASHSASEPPSNPSAQTGAASAEKTTPAKSCPPSKIIVRQGGTTEPSIQLAGGPTAAEAARKRDAVNQLLGATNQNLKKTAGWQLSSSQQDTITQTRQFMEQSKTAMADGDLERARTLAWKAELLSEDLVTPQK